MTAPSMNSQGNPDVELPDERLWTVEEVATFLRIPVSTLYRWRSQRTGPKGRRIGKHLRYRPEDVHAWVAKQD